MPNADPNRRGGHQSFDRTYFAPPMCALPHLSRHLGEPMLRVSGASPTTKEKSWES
jgi:hypothetical protein